MADSRTRSRAKITRELRFLSGQLTDRCRFLAVAVIGACWVLMSSPSVHAPTLLRLAILLAILAVTADFLQYATQYHHFAKRHRIMVMEDLERIEVDDTAFLYRGRRYFFHLKLWLTAASASLFCYAAGTELVQRPFGAA